MMNLSSNTLMDTFSTKARNLLALLLAVGTWQASIPVALLLTSSALLTAENVYQQYIILRLNKYRSDIVSWLNSL